MNDFKKNWSTFNACNMHMIFDHSAQELIPVVLKIVHKVFRNLVIHRSGFTKLRAKGRFINES